MGMPSLGDNVVSDGAAILMLSQIRKKTRKNKTTRQSLMVPSFTSSSYWEERGLRCAVVCDSTHLRSVVGGRCCERSQG